MWRSANSCRIAENHKCNLEVCRSPIAWYFQYILHLFIISTCNIEVCSLQITGISLNMYVNINVYINLYGISADPGRASKGRRATTTATTITTAAAAATTHAPPWLGPKMDPKRLQLASASLNTSHRGIEVGSGRKCLVLRAQEAYHSASSTQGPATWPQHVADLAAKVASRWANMVQHGPWALQASAWAILASKWVPLENPCFTMCFGGFGVPYGPNMSQDWPNMAPQLCADPLPPPVFYGVLWLLSQKKCSVLQLCFTICLGHFVPTWPLDGNLATTWSNLAPTWPQHGFNSPQAGPTSPPSSLASGRLSGGSL